MGNRLQIDQPAGEWEYVDTHCHVPWTGGRSRTSSPEKQLEAFKQSRGKFFITSAIDLESSKILHEFAMQHDSVHFSCGWAPQTVTYTPVHEYEQDLQEWKSFVESRVDDIIAFGELGLDFHHAKTLQERERQVNELESILSFLLEIDGKKPVALHVRNASPRDKDTANPNHPYNEQDGATNEILKVMDAMGVNLNKVLFHCFSGPKTMNDYLVSRGFLFSVPSSAFSIFRWYNVSKNLPLDRLVTETDSPFQHPWLRKPVNTPSNAKYSIAAIANSHDTSQEEVARQTVENAIKFFNVQ